MKEVPEDSVFFKDINIGNCFAFNGNVYIKCKEIACVNSLSKQCEGDFDINAVQIGNYYFAWFSEYDSVTPMKVKVIFDEV